MWHKARKTCQDFLFQLFWKRPLCFKSAKCQKCQASVCCVVFRNLLWSGTIFSKERSLILSTACCIYYFILLEYVVNTVHTDAQSIDISDVTEKDLGSLSTNTAILAPLVHSLLPVPATISGPVWMPFLQSFSMFEHKCQVKVLMWFCSHSP